MRSLKQFAKLVLSLAAIFAVLVVIGNITSKPPKETKVVSEFRARRAAYEQILTLLSEDKGVDVVASWGIETAGSPISGVPPEGGMSVERYQEYLRVLKLAGARAVARGTEPNEVRFLVWGSGFAGDTRHVAVSWLEGEPPHSSPSLEAFYQTPKPRTPAYVHIDGNWYLWADW